jgi:hypothetical protein
MLTQKTIRRGSRNSVETYSGEKLPETSTVEFLEAAVDRMFSADEVTRAVDLERLKRLKHQIVSLFSTR